MKNKTLYILVGPKGSGKTTIGKVVDQQTSITFLPVEPIWIKLKAEPSQNLNGWDLVIEEIEQQFNEVDEVMIESLGLGDAFSQVFDYFKERCGIKLIKVTASPESCLSRVISRDKSQQLEIAVAKIQEYNQMAFQVEKQWDLEINNNGPLDLQLIVKSVLSLKE